jgi:hypothetical protein
MGPKSRRQHDPERTSSRSWTASGGAASLGRGVAVVVQLLVARRRHVVASFVSGFSLSSSSSRKLLEEGNLGSSRLATRRNDRHRRSDESCCSIPFKSSFEKNVQRQLLGRDDYDSIVNVAFGETSRVLFALGWTLSVSSEERSAFDQRPFISSSSWSFEVFQNRGPAGVNDTL